METLLYKIVSEEELKSMIHTFYSCMELPIQVLDDHGALVAESGELNPFCQRFQKYLPVNDSCERLHMIASKRAVELGEPYIFSCHAELNHIVYPLINNHTFLGSILVGPFLMDEPDSLLINGIQNRYQIPVIDTFDLYDEIKIMKILAPAKVNHISRLVYYLFSNLIGESMELLKHNNKKLLQQNLINESIQRYKEELTFSGAYPYEKEKELLNNVKYGNTKEANATLNELLGYVFFSEGNSLEIVKSRALELCTLLSRTAIEGGAATDNILKLNNQFIKNLQQITSLDSLCFKLQEVVETFAESLFHYTNSQNNEYIKRSMVYIAGHFNEPLTLDDIAAHVGMHPSYFSTRFKQITGSSFREHLNMIRIEESKRLLSNTDFSIIDIAIAVGFEDQSYFSKVFKKITGMTPKQYR